MKLDINKSYIVFTISDYITNIQVRILGWIGYEKASQYNNFIENVAINEKFIAKNGDTAEYLRKQTYYECAVIKLSDGEYIPTGERIILWDDIIDTERTQRLYEDYNYKFSFKFKNVDDSDELSKTKVITAIKNCLNEKFNINKVKIDFSMVELLDNSEDSDAAKLKQTELILKDAIATLKSFTALQETAKDINSSFTDNNIGGRVTKLASSFGEIEESVNRILANMK